MNKLSTISLKDFLVDFDGYNFESLDDRERKIFPIFSKKDNKKYILKLSKIDEGSIKRYIQKFNEVALLEHQHLIKHVRSAAINPGHFGKNVAEIFEFANFGTLIDYLQSKVKFSEAIKAFSEAFAGIKHLHDHHILHRDIKPTNILIHEEDGIFMAKIADIEFWCQADGKDTRSTPEYLAPEVSHFDEYTIKSELWAIGVMLYELFTGKYPFGSRLEGLSVDEIRENVKSGDVVGIENLPPPFNKIVGACLRKKPEERPVHMGELIKILESVQVV